ncbi:methyltransferase [Cohnella soli]|uniref:Methyltransferase n=1 Tax=Cohnella soli TaxID=425005 RepID=A0ABW0HPI2_9BACL
MSNAIMSVNESQLGALVNPSDEQANILLNPMAVVDAYHQKFRLKDYVLADVLAAFYALKHAKEEIKLQLLEKVNRSEAHKRRRIHTKKEIVERFYKQFLNEVAHADSHSFSYLLAMDGNFEAVYMEALDEKVASMTDESIAAHLASQNQEIAARVKAMENPETLSELRMKKSAVGLNEEEQVRLDELEAHLTRERDAAPTVQRSEVNVSGFSLEETKHTKTHETIFVVRLKERLDRDTYNTIQAQMRSIGGGWSKFTQGFNFKADPSERLKAIFGNETDAVEESAAADVEPSNKAAEKLRTVADNMQKSIDDKRRDRPTHTHRMASMAASAAKEADELERIQRIMRNLADAMERGDAIHLDGVTARTHIETLDGFLRSRVYEQMQKNKEQTLDRNGSAIRRDPTLEDINGMTYPKPEMASDTLELFIKEMTGNALKGTSRLLARVQKEIAAQRGRQRASGWFLVDATPIFDELSTLISKAKTVPFAGRINDLLTPYKRLQTMGIKAPEQFRSALREYLNYRAGTGLSEEEKKKRSLAQRESETTRMKIPGYFPTPKETVDIMMANVAIEAGDKVLEPSAGKGNIAEALIAHEGADVDVIEINSTLRGILEDKGFNIVAYDFLAYQVGGYDAIVMNPPFENGQDIEHVQHAYELLKPGGRLVAIMSEGPFYRSDKPAMTFREWLDGKGGVSEKLPEGSFKSAERPTGVATRIVVVDK